jgi:hypothetical protein
MLRQFRAQSIPDRARINSIEEDGDSSGFSFHPEAKGCYNTLRRANHANDPPRRQNMSASGVNLLRCNGVAMVAVQARNVGSGTMPPALVLSLLLGSIYGLLFHSIFGRKLWQLPCFWLSAVIGFYVGEILAILAGAELLRLGNISLIPATAGALAGLLICWFFTSAPQPRTRGRGTVRRG